MKSRELKELRQHLGLSRLEMARLIGYTGTDRNDEMRIRKYETTQQVPLHIARFVWLILRYWDHTGALPKFPRWSGYDFSHEPDPQHQEEVP
jgi:transcriptional regulator with XRE-family HTH domain